MTVKPIMTKYIFLLFLIHFFHKKLGRQLHCFCVTYMNDNQFKLKTKTETFLLFAVRGWVHLLRFNQAQVTVSSEGRLTYQQGGVATTHDANEEKNDYIVEADELLVSFH